MPNFLVTFKNRGRVKKIFLIIVFFLLLYIFRLWFTFNTLGGFDFYFYWPDKLHELSLIPFAWEQGLNNGLGGNSIQVLWADRFLQTFVFLFVNKLNWSWEFTQRLFLLWPYLILIFISPYLFLKKTLTLKGENIFLPIGIIVFSLNSYILMLVTGGQINLALSYATAPLVFLLFQNLMDVKSGMKLLVNIRNSLYTGLVLAVQILFDLRIAYVTLLAILLYFVISLIVKKSAALKQTPYLILTAVIASLLHSFWLLPQLVIKNIPVLSDLNNPNWLPFLSWADLSNSISLLHPNWPDNIFGKIYFMRPEFLGIPIVAFFSLFFLNKPKSKIENNIPVSQNPKILIVFFALLGLLGAFLSKGVNPPISGIYYWLFTKLPFFYIFRDPTKFYLLVALSYTFLIPFSLTYLTGWLKDRLKKNGIEIIISLVFLSYWFVLLIPVFSGQVKGMLIQQQTPQEYSDLANFLSGEPGFYRTLWVPKVDRLGYQTDRHPELGADTLLGITDLTKILDSFNKTGELTFLQNLSVKYIIVPYDSEAQIFLADRKYDDSQRQKVVKTLDKLPYLHKISQPENKLTIYKISGFKDHFWLNEKNANLIYTIINPTKYDVKVENVQKGNRLVFSDKFDKNWQATIVTTSQNVFVESTSYLNFNSFILPLSGNYSVEVSYEPQKLVDMGSIISLTTLTLCMLFLAYTLIKHSSMASSG